MIQTGHHKYLINVKQAKSGRGKIKMPNLFCREYNFESMQNIPHVFTKRDSFKDQDDFISNFKPIG